jgi:hypothetical protein
MLGPAPGQIDPLTSYEQILPHEKIATMGSCFAQHLAKHIEASGLNYYVAETAPSEMALAEAKRRNYGVFSARYGNVYTVRQALQLFDRSFGSFVPAEDVWRKDDGFVDPFRPQIEPDPFDSPAAVRGSAAVHLGHVRRVFSECDWLVFTLGLTEAWRSKVDGAIYPTAPGVSGGTFDPAQHEFVNFTADEVQRDLADFIQKLHDVNPTAKVLLTVSPVPLIATYEKRHVLVSTTFSKAALRVAADVAERTFQQVTYFPAYEIITSPAAGGRYFCDDLRQIRDVGVRHVMRVFSRHFVGGTPHTSPRVGASLPNLAPDDDIVCDEEVIERALQASGFKNR